MLRSPPHTIAQFVKAAMPGQRCRTIFRGAAVAILGLFVYSGAPVRGDGFDKFRLSNPAYSLLAERMTANQTRFYVYQDADSGFNHGFLSGLFGRVEKLQIEAACVDDPTSVDGCSTDPNGLDRERGTVLRISFAPLAPGQFAGVNIEEPEQWGVRRTGRGYDLHGATQVVFDVRSPTPGGITVQFGVGGSTSEFLPIPQSSAYLSMALPLTSLQPAPPSLDDVHILFTVVTNDVHASNGGTVLLDNIRFEPVPLRQQSALGFPLSTQTFGVVPLQTPAPGCVPIPPDQLLRNVTTIYESALTLLALLARGADDDLRHARLLADTFV